MLPAFWAGAAWAVPSGDPDPDMWKADTFPWLENFNSEVFPPEGWTQIQMEGTSLWELGDAGWMGTMERVTSAYHPAASGMQHTALVSPAIAIPEGDNSYELTFWSNMSYTYTSYDYSGIWVSTTSSTDFSSFEELYAIPMDTSLTSINMNAAQFGPVSLDRYKGETIHIALVYKGDNAHKWYVDDVEIREISPSGTFSGATALDLGIVFNNTDLVIYKDYAITNTGGADLLVSGVASATDGLEVDADFPLTLAPEESRNIRVGLDAYGRGLPQGNFTGDFVLTTDDPDHAEASVSVSARVKASAYGFEDFNHVEDLVDGLFPYGWSFSGSGTQEVSWEPYEGVENSPYLMFDIPKGEEGNLYTFYYGMGDSPKVSFCLKATRFDGNGVPFPATRKHFTYDVMIPENGEAWKALAEDASLEEVSDFSKIELDAAEYAGKTCMIKFVFRTDEDESFVDVGLDNVSVGSALEEDLEAVLVSGTTRPVAGQENQYEVDVRNLGVKTQSTYAVKLVDADGNELAETGGLEVAQGETKAVPLVWVPEKEGPCSIRAVVSLENDENSLNDTTPWFPLEVLPATMRAVAIGDGTSLVSSPLNLSNEQSLSQSLYFAEEICTNGGEIKGLIYHSKMDDTGSAPLRIWVGETSLNSLYDVSTGQFNWVDPASLTEVFNGTVTFRSEDGADVLVEFGQSYP